MKSRKRNGVIKMTLNQQAEIKVNELASQVMKGEMLESFLKLDLKAKLTGIAVFAHISDDTSIRDACLQTLKLVK